MENFYWKGRELVGGEERCGGRRGKKKDGGEKE